MPKKPSANLPWSSDWNDEMLPEARPTVRLSRLAAVKYSAVAELRRSRRRQWGL